MGRTAPDYRATGVVAVTTKPGDAEPWRYET